MAVVVMYFYSWHILGLSFLSSFNQPPYLSLSRICLIGSPQASGPLELLQTDLTYTWWGLLLIGLSLFVLFTSAMPVAEASHSLQPGQLHSVSIYWWPRSFCFLIPSSTFHDLWSLLIFLCCVSILAVLCVQPIFYLILVVQHSLASLLAHHQLVLVCRYVSDSIDFLLFRLSFSSIIPFLL